MACAVAAPLLEPSRDFPAWLEAQGVNAEVAQAMDSELGIRDYGVLCACVGDGLVRAELLATARDRLPFGFYAVLRQVVKALQGAEPCDGETSPRWDDNAVASSPGNVMLGGLVDVLLTLFSSLSRELLLSVRRLGAIDVDQCTSPTVKVNDQDLVVVNEELPSEENSKFSSHSELRLQREEVGEDAVMFSEDCHSSKVLYIETVEHQADGYIYGPPSEHNLTSVNPAAGCISHASELTEAGDGSWQRRSGETVEQHMIPVLQYPMNDVSDGGQAAVLCGEARSYSCRVCKHTCRSEADLIDHWSTHSDKLPHCCITCGKFFQNSNDLSIHEQSHTVKKLYCCTVCERTFLHLSSLKRHHRTHTGEKPYRCGVCGKAFTSKHNMTLHHQSKHGGMGLLE